MLSIFTTIRMDLLTALVEAPQEANGNYIWATLWLAVCIAALIIESQTADLVSIWFAPGAFVSMLLAFFDVPVLIQLIVFALLTITGLTLTFIFFRPRLKKSMKDEKLDVHSLEGREAMVVEDVDNAAAQGAVKINGQLWTVIMEDPNDKPVKGDWVLIKKVAGSKLICIPRLEGNKPKKEND